MKKIGLAYPVVALYDDSTGVPVYTSGTVMSKAIKYSVKYDKNDVRVDADDSLDELDNSVTGATVTFGVNELVLAIRSLVLGHAIVDGALRIGKNDMAPYVGCGIYSKVKLGGVYKYAATWFYKAKFGEPDDEAETQGEKMAFNMPTIEAKAMFAVNEMLNDVKVFDTEADAKAWLNGLARIPVSASTGLTALSLTGTGGTLTPAFGVGVRSYAFSGVTGTAVTVTPTAAGVIQLFINGVFSQNITTATASASIPMAVIGTKKLTLIVQEAGKSSQTTDILVVKTA